MREMVELELCQIFRDKVAKDFEKNQNLKSKNLFGYDVGLQPCDLLLIMYSIEKKFQFQFAKEDILSYGLETYNKILQIILKHTEF